MKFVKVILIVSAVLIALGAGLWQFFLREQIAFARAGTAYAAKQVCSCLYVGQRDVESCKGDFTVDVSPFDFRIESEAVTVSVLSGLVSGKAVFQDDLGCALVKS